MSWQLLIVLSIFLYSSSILLQRFLLKEKESNPILYSIIYQFFTGLILVCFGFLFSNMTFPYISKILPNILLMIVLYGFGTIFSFKSLKNIEASKYIVIFSTRAFFTLIFSSVLLNETLTSKQFFGFFLIFLGVVLVSFNKSKFTFGKAEMLAFLTAGLFGIATTNDSYLLNFFDVYPYVSLGFIGPSILIALTHPQKLKNIIFFFDGKRIVKVLILSFVCALWAISFFTALKKTDNSSLIASINTINVVVTVIFAVVFLGERKNLFKKITGAFFSFLGLLMFV